METQLLTVGSSSTWSFTTLNLTGTSHLVLEFAFQAAGWCKIKLYYSVFVHKEHVSQNNGCAFDNNGAVWHRKVRSITLCIWTHYLLVGDIHCLSVNLEYNQIETVKMDLRDRGTHHLCLLTRMMILIHCRHHTLLQSGAAGLMCAAGETHREETFQSGSYIQPCAVLTWQHVYVCILYPTLLTQRKPDDTLS